MKQDNTIAVSILCVTYNHANFIRKTLDGFLMQKTNFSYEIIVHDDASVDGTADILKEYQEKYPDKIRLLLEHENQYSKGTRILATYLFPEIRGKYAAICEGDDEWIFDGKMQQQYDLMENNPNIALCMHNAKRRDFENAIEINQVNGLGEGIVEDEEIILSTKGRMPTASFFFRAECILDYPKFNLDAPVGDDPLRYHCACKGDIYYMDKIWCVRNYMHKGSWNYAMKNSSFQLVYIKGFLKYLYSFNHFSEGRFQIPLRSYMIMFCQMAIDIMSPKGGSVQMLQETIQQFDRETDYMFSDVLQNVYKMKEKECIDYVDRVVMKFIQDYLDADGKLYIYGVGEEAKKCADILKEMGMKYEGFLVSEGHRKQNEYFGHKIYLLNEVDELTSKVFIWLGLNDKNKAEVLDVLKKKNYYHIL